MNARERGFLLLTSHLGNPQRKPLTVSQLRILAGRVRTMERPMEEEEVSVSRLRSLGYGTQMCERIVHLLAQEEELDYYLKRGKQKGCIPVTRVSPLYPLILRQRLGPDSPGCLWVKGDVSLLSAPAVSVVGSRDIYPEHASFAGAVARHAAGEGIVLISGNARGADTVAQQACLESGGKVISIVADQLSRQDNCENTLYISEEDFDAPFSAQRALSRNRCIHAMGRITFVAQSRCGKGGTWDGTVKNLHNGWSPVACFRDGSDASLQLEQMGAFLVTQEDLADLSGMLSPQLRLF